jgi:hypothetical protein
MRVNLKDGEMVVKQNDFGLLVDSYVRGLIRYNPYVADGPDGTDARLREWWPQLEEYWQRQIQVSIEVAIHMDEYPPPAHSDRKPLQNKELWIKFLKDFRPSKSPFTVDYSCDKCKAKGVKLWRQSHTFADHIDLLCATCLAPDEKVDDNGKWQEPPYKDKDGKQILEGYRTDQVKGRVPAVPVGDTYWGYTSVPSQDVEWWVGLPTYPSKR